MMIDPPLNEIMEKVDSRYTLVVEVAKRARQLVAGEKPLIEVEDESAKPVTIAVHEVNLEKIKYRSSKEGIK
jgi:DNA-directed RNA polymerase subunit omega